MIRLVIKMIFERLKIIPKSIVLLLGVVGLVYLVFINGLSLHKTEYRSYKTFSLKEDEVQELYANIDPTSDDIEIIKRCNEFVCKKLSFHRRNNLNIREANCVGYAQYTATILNSAFKYKNLSSKARPVAGQVHLYGFNLHPLVMTIMPIDIRPFFKDHDFVEIIKENGDTIFIDTSLQDLLGKSFL